MSNKTWYTQGVHEDIIIAFSSKLGGSAVSGSDSKEIFEFKTSKMNFANNRLTKFSNFLYKFQLLLKFRGRYTANFGQKSWKSQQ